MATTTAVGAEEPNPGRAIDCHGVVICPSFWGVPPKVPAHGAERITSHVMMGYDDTTGNVTQCKIDLWEPGGSFKEHDHPEPRPMDELFFVLEGVATFTYNQPDGEARRVEVSAGGSVFFPAGTWHAGCNRGERSAYVLVIGIRAGVQHLQDKGKGKNIPVA